MCVCVKAHDREKEAVEYECLVGGLDKSRGSHSCDPLE